jgi:hypothetical protein
MYRSRPIEECPDWSPGPYWSSWKILGPPAGDRASALLGDLSTEPISHGDDQMPSQISNLLGDKFVGRQEQRTAQLKASVKTCKTESSLSSTPVKSSTQTRPRDGIKLFDAYTRERELRSQRLEKLMKLPGVSTENLKKYVLEYSTKVFLKNLWFLCKHAYLISQTNSCCHFRLNLSYHL